MKHHEPKKATRETRRRPSLPKAPTGIQGLDELTGGGLPRGRPTLLCGGAGCGKTLLAMEFLVREQEIAGKNRELERKRQAMEARILALRAEFESEHAEEAKTSGQDQKRDGVLAGDRVQMARLRQADAAGAGKRPEHQRRAPGFVPPAQG